MNRSLAESSQTMSATRTPSAGKQGSPGPPSPAPLARKRGRPPSITKAKEAARGKGARPAASNAEAPPEPEPQHAEPHDAPAAPPPAQPDPVVVDAEPMQPGLIASPAPPEQLPIKREPVECVAEQQDVHDEDNKSTDLDETLLSTSASLPLHDPPVGEPATTLPTISVPKLSSPMPKISAPPHFKVDQPVRGQAAMPLPSSVSAPPPAPVPAPAPASAPALTPPPAPVPAPAPAASKPQLMRRTVTLTPSEPKEVAAPMNTPMETNMAQYVPDGFCFVMVPSREQFHLRSVVAGLHSGTDCRAGTNSCSAPPKSTRFGKHRFVTT